MLHCAKEAYRLCDSTKIGRKSFAKFAELNEFRYVITDTHIDDETELKIAGVTKVLKA